MPASVATRFLSALYLVLSATCTPAVAQFAPPQPSSTAADHSLPRIVHENGRYALFVDGSPYLILGAQVNNSSAWPAMLPKVWPAIEYLHCNTVEMPVYWEQFEPEPGRFDYSVVDILLAQSRAHARAQMLAAPLLRCHVVDRDDHRTGAVQHRALHPGCMKYVVCLAGAMRLDDLSALGIRVAQRIEQAARVAPHAAHIGGGTAVEGDSHGRLLDSTRLFTGPPGNTRRAR